MQYCKYHPLQAATFCCNTCDTFSCDKCIDIGRERREVNRCFSCENEVESLGATYNAEPFWRRLEQSFRYPLNVQTMVLIIGVSALTALLSYAPFTFLWILILTGAFVRYAFTCLEQSSEGILEAPDINEAYQGGVGLLFQLLFIFASIVGMVIGAGYVLGAPAATFVGVISAIALPAIIINFATSGDLLESLNPLKTFGLIMSVGLPYGLLLAFIMIMSASVGVLQNSIGDEFTLVNSILQSIIANYYVIVIFHIMGYMIFQYQGKLGFTARASTDEAFTERSDLDALQAKIDVTVKEGEFETAADLFGEAVKKFPTDGPLLHKCFDFLYACKNQEDIVAFAPRYMSYLIKSQSLDKLNLVYKKVLQIAPGFVPKTPELRYALAIECSRVGDSKAVVKLVNGLHKQSPQFEYLVEAYELLASALGDIPNMGERVVQCQRLVEKLKGVRQQSAKLPVQPPSKVSFGAKDITPTFGEAEPKAAEQDTEESAEPESKELPPIEFK